MRYTAADFDWQQLRRSSGRRDSESEREDLPTDVVHGLHKGDKSLISEDVNSAHVAQNHQENLKARLEQVTIQYAGTKHEVISKKSDIIPYQDARRYSLEVMQYSQSMIQTILPGPSRLRVRSIRSVLPFVQQARLQIWTNMQSWNVSSVALQGSVLW